MNCPSKTDPEVPDDWNQSPNALSGDTTTCSDLSKIANARLQRDHRLRDDDPPDIELIALQQPSETAGKTCHAVHGIAVEETGEHMLEETVGSAQTDSTSQADPKLPAWRRYPKHACKVLLKYAKFIGPGFMISVAYIDPGNYATDVAAGASYRFKLLFMVLLSNLFAIYLQSLCIKLGSVTGMNLAEMCKAHFPRWLNYTLYAFAEAAIIATDIAEVIGTAIALNLLLHIPLVAGCAISIADVLFILLFYRPESNSMRALRAFEFFVVLLVLGVVVSFCFSLSLIRNTRVAEVFRGYLPSSALVQGQGLYQACGILGATVMPHSLYLGSGIVQARLKDFDKHHKPTASSNASSTAADTDEDDTTSITEQKYRPSLSAIKACLSYSIAELAISLFTFALFVNSAILIVAGASLSNVAGAESADLFGIHALLSRTVAPAAGTIFALALLLSGVSAGIICTIAGQMVSEGQLDIRVKPWVRRLMTRSISITPSIIIAGAVGKEGLSAALEGTQVALSVILPFVSAPLIYFTMRDKYMSVGTGVVADHGTGLEHPGVHGDRIGFDEQSDGEEGMVKMGNHWLTTTFAVAIWGIITVMDVAALVLLGLGVG